MNPGTPFSLLLIAAGGILAWGVTDTVEEVNFGAIGVILMVVGALGLLLSLAFWSSVFGGGSRHTVVRDEPRTVYRDRPTVYVDRGDDEVVTERHERVVRRDDSTYRP